MLGLLPILPLPAPPLDGNLGPLPLAQITELSNGSDDSNNEKNNKPSSVPATVATHTGTIGIIHPPPDIRTIVDRTALFVGKNGPEFVKMIVAKNIGNANFNFLNVSNPYHACYQHRISEVRAKSQAPTQQPAPPSQSADSSAPEAAVDEKKPDPSAQFRPVWKILEPPEAEQYTVCLPEGITEEEVDIIKLIAQVVACNGRSFLIGLTSRELNNPQFHFLQPTHSMFTFFTSLADAYSKVLMPPKGLTEKLKKSVADRTTVLERCLRRLEWESSQEQARQKAEDEVEQERMQMAMIDWHDFVVVETIDFVDDEDHEIPAPMTLEEIMRRSKLSAAMEVEEEEVVKPGKEMEIEMDEEEVQLVEEGTRTVSLDEENEMKTEIKSPIEDGPPIRIVKNWKRPEKRVLVERDAMKYARSPITGELIPINEMSEHMRISLIDPKYKDQKGRMYATIRETTLAQDDEISKNIVGLARLRPDIFGTTEEEVLNAVKAEIEKKKDEQPKQVIWEDTSDPTTGDLPGPAAPPPPRPVNPLLRPLPPPPVILSCVPPVQMMQPCLQPQTPISYYPGQQHFMINRPLSMNPPGIPVHIPPSSQFTPISASQPFVPIPPQPGMHMMPPPPEEAPPQLPEEPEPKRQRLNDSVLIPEDQFLAQHPGPVHVSISVPNVDEGNLKGQVLEIMVQSLSETVGSLKEKIAGETQLPSNKQKLSGKAGFLKDNLSLAYYNFAAGDTLALSLRERGGRKR